MWPPSSSMTNQSRLILENNCVFQQDRAPSHTSRVTQAHLKQVRPEIIKKDEWPSLRSEPMNCAIMTLSKRKLTRE